MSAHGSVLVAGVGPGLGIAVARRFADLGHRVAMLARSRDRLAALAAPAPELLIPTPCDVTDPAAVAAAFDDTEQRLGPLACVVFNAGAFRRGSILDITAEDFERCWRVGAFAGFLVGRAAARRMVPSADRAPSCSPAPRRRCAAGPASPTSPRQVRACARWRRAWRASSRRAASTSRT